MSYIVKSRDFPKSCNECDEPHLCCDFYYCGVGHQKDGRHLDVDEHYLNKTKHPDCPLLELPKKHGRLIDADKLLKSIDIMREQRCKTCSSRIDTKHCDRNGCWMIFISDFIGSLPTIIGAEVSE